MRAQLDGGVGRTNGLIESSQKYGQHESIEGHQ